MEDALNGSVLGIVLTTWTVRISLGCYAVTLYGNLAWSSRPSWKRWARGLWSAGCLLLLAHVACAFHFVHHWEHAHAVAETARQTDELVGWEFGGGVYFNYLFALLWIADVVWWWSRPESYERRPLAVSVAIHSYLFFIAFNGAIIFEDGPTRWFGLLFIAALFGQAIRTRCVASM